MLAKVLSCAVTGLDGELVEVEVDRGRGLPSFVLVGLPDAGGIYLLDAMNPTAGDINTGARVDYDFLNPTILHALNGNLAGGQVGLTVIPEPATLGLLLLGGLVLIKRGR